LDKKSNLIPKLGLFTTVAIVVGGVIGSGIFKKPAVMADQLGSPELLLAVWLMAGILTLFGALTNAEIAGIIPVTGGQYVFFDKIYGRFVAFMYGWALIVVIQTGSIASITYVFSQYSQYFDAFYLPEFFDKATIDSSSFHLPLIGIKIKTVAIIFLLSAINYVGVIFGGGVTNLFTTMKVMAILALVVFGFSFSGGSMNNFTMDSATVSLNGMAYFPVMIAALSGALWAFDGWNNITYIAGEVKNANRNIPKALFIGTLIIIAVYSLINLAYIYVLPVEEMAKSSLVAADMAIKSVGTFGAAFVSAAVMISTFGTSNNTIMVSARVYYAMSQDGMFFPVIGKTHKKFLTPANALILQAVWSSCLVFSGTFDTLTDMLIFVSWIFYAAGAAGVFILRKKMPDVERPYKVWGYPYVPIIFIVVATIYVFVTLYNDIVLYLSGGAEIINSFYGLFLLSTGLPFYFYFNYQRKKIKNQKDN